MRKGLKTLIVSLAMVSTMTLTAFADRANDLKNELLALGVPSSYVGNAVEYLQKTTLTEADYNKAMGYINQAKAIIGDSKDLSKLSQSDKNTLQSLASKAGNALGLKVSFGKDSKGVTTVVLTDSKGGIVVSMSTTDISGLATDFDMSVIVGVLQSAVEFSHESSNSNGDASKPGDGEFKPVGGELSPTATTYPTAMLLGAGMVVGAGAMAIKAKKQYI